MQELEIVGHLEADQVFAQVAGQIGESSVRSYRRALQEYLAWLHKPFYEATRVDISQYRAYVVKKFTNAKTAQPKFSIVLRFYAEAFQTPEIAALFANGNPAVGQRGIKMQDTAQRRHIALEVDQVRALLRAIPSQRDRLIALMLLHTGLRRSELASIRVGMIDAVGAYWRVIIRGKGGKTREVKIPQHVKDEIDAYLSTRVNVSGDSPLFVAETRNKETAGMAEAPLSPNMVYRVVHMAGERIGVKLTAHSTRVTFVTTGLENGASVQDMAVVVGHSDVKTTIKYNRSRNLLRNNPADRVVY